MRRMEKAITDRQAMEAVIRAAQVCHVAMAHDDHPYVVAMNFGYANGVIYLHCAREGRKLEILRQNNRVCCAFETGLDLVRADAPCQWGMRFQSVIAFGTARLVEEREEKEAGLQLIMGQYSREEFHFPPAAVDNTALIRIDIATMTGKQAG